MKVTLSDTAVCALSLDDTGIQNAMQLTEVGRRRRGRGGQTDFEGDETSIKNLADTLRYRGECQGGEGFDDPPSWSHACRVAANRILGRLTK